MFYLWISTIIATARWTWRQSPQMAIRGCAIHLLLTVIYLWLRPRPWRIAIQRILILLLARVLIALSIRWYQSRYEAGAPIYTSSRSGPVTITDTARSAMAIVDIQGRSYRMDIEDFQVYPLDTQLRVSGFVDLHTLPLWTYTSADESRARLSDRGLDRPQRLRMRGLHGTLYPAQMIVTTPADPSWRQSARQRLIDTATQLYDDPDRRGLLLGMIIGDRSQFQDDTYDGFISSGLVHLIAVSGGNLVMIIVFLSAILFRVPLYIRTVIIMGAIISYALIVGADSSIIRAVIMALLIMTALLAGRTTDIRRLMMIASLLMLRRNPYYLRHDIGFVFSYMALIGIILTTQWSARRARLHPMTAHRLIHRPVSHYIIPTIGASLGVMPALLFFTGSFSILSLLGNIIVLPVVPLVMIGGAISLALGYYRDITWPARLIDQLLQYIMTISEWIAHTSPQLLLADQWFGWLLLGRLVSYIIIHHHPKTDPDTSNLLHRP